MFADFLRELKLQLARSDSKMRKAWAEKIKCQGIELRHLMSLLHADPGTAQRFTWLLGDVCEIAPEMMIGELPMLFELRNEMPFPGMRRSIAKWLWLTNVPKAIEAEAIEQLFEWLGSEQARVAPKSFAAKGLLEMAKQGRASENRFRKVLKQECRHENRAYASRMAKILNQLSQKS